MAGDTGILLHEREPGAGSVLILADHLLVVVQQRVLEITQCYENLHLNFRLSATENSSESLGIKR